MRLHLLPSKEKVEFLQEILHEQQTSRIPSPLSWLCITLPYFPTKENQLSGKAHDGQVFGQEFPERFQDVKQWSEIYRSFHRCFELGALNSCYVTEACAFVSRQARVHDEGLSVYDGTQLQDNVYMH
jgi:hypothetical protein